MNKIYIYPRYIRFWHMLNALLMLILILTGLSMQYSSFNGSLIPFSLSVQMHNISGILLAASYLLFLIGNTLSGNGKHYRLQWQGLRKRIFIQGRYYLYGYFKKQSPPFPVSSNNKFNPLQAITYVMVMYIGTAHRCDHRIWLTFPGNHSCRDLWCKRTGTNGPFTCYHGIFIVSLHDHPHIPVHPGCQSQT